MLKRLSYSILIAIVAIVSINMPVLAIDDPDVPPNILAVYIYEGLIEAGDMGVFIDYFIDYTIAGIPTETVTESYLAAFIDTDGVTQISTVAPYTFIEGAYTDNGYQRGMVWIYISAADVTANAIDSANIALHEVWLMGNPTVASGWAGVPPKTTSGIDFWQTSGNTAELLAIRVLTFAEILNTAWGIVMMGGTALGSRLTIAGESYFENAMQNLRTMAPTCFAVTTLTQTQEDLDYTTEFGATVEDGTGTIPVSPLDLVEGVNTVDITGNGTLIVTLENGTVGTAADNPGGGTVVGSPTPVVAGVNTITVALAGTNDILITVNLVDTQTTITDTITGTGLDLGTTIPGSIPLPVRFGMSTMMMSGLVWMIITIIICAATYKAGSRLGAFRGGSGKAVMIVFDICIIGGGVLGLLSILVAALLFIGFGIVTGYVLFYRHASF